MAVATNKSAVPAAAQRRAGDDTEGPVPEFSKEQDLAALRDMLLIRRFEEKAGQLYGMGLIGGFCHLYIGQEAVVVLGNAQWPVLRRHVDRVVAALSGAAPGSYSEVQIPVK